MKKSLYIFNDGDLKRKGNTICFDMGDKKKYVPIENIKELFIFGEVSVTKKILELLSQKEIILHFFNYYGYYTGSFYPREHLNSGYMILKQATFYNDCTKRNELAYSFINGGAQNIKKVLLYYNNRGKDVNKVIDMITNLMDKLNPELEVDQLMAIEGNIRETYYKSFDTIINNPDFAFIQRSKRPPKNALNALISFGNSIMYTMVLSEIYKTHLDPRIGYLHTTNFRRFSLNLDVAEIFKPVIVDRLILSLIAKGILTKKDFEKRLGGILLNEKGKKKFIKGMEEKLQTTIKHKKIGKPVSYRRLLRLELYKIEKHFMEEEKYEPFIAQW